MGLKTPTNFWTKWAILLVLSVLVGMFFLSIMLMSSLNLSFAHNAMADLRQQQIA